MPSNLPPRAAARERPKRMGPPRGWVWGSRRLSFQEQGAGRRPGGSIGHGYGEANEICDDFRVGVGGMVDRLFDAAGVDVILRVPRRGRRGRSAPRYAG